MCVGVGGEFDKCYSALCYIPPAVISKAEGLRRKKEDLIDDSQLEETERIEN